MKFTMFSVMLFLLSIGFVSAANQIYVDFGNGYSLQTDVVDQCNVNTYLDNGEVAVGFRVESNCSSVPVEVEWNEDVELVFGPLLEGEFETGRNWVYVDSIARPDLDLPATIRFTNHGFITDPIILRNGIPCEGVTCELISCTSTEIVFNVTGFSNYSLSYSQDFTVYSDPYPELKTKTYQTIDLGDAYRNTTFACVVQIFGSSADSPGEWILVQTNPQRNVQARMFGSPDANQPESLGYFSTVNGMANTYFDGSSLSGYNEFQLVIQCADGSQKLVYEEPISTRYSPIGRNAVARGVWLTDDYNGFFVVIYIVGGLILLWVVILVFRRTFRRY